MDLFTHIPKPGHVTGKLSRLLQNRARRIHLVVLLLFLALLGGLATNLSCGSDKTDNGSSQVTPPTITASPASQEVLVGQSVSFSVTASGTAPLQYQWLKGTTPVGSDAPSLSISVAQLSDAGSYTVKVSNSAGNQVSAAAVLKVTPPSQQLGITKQPTTQSVSVGKSVSFTVVASGPAGMVFHYQWKKDGSNTGTNRGTLSIASAQLADAGTYTVTVSDAASSQNSITSAGAVLTVHAPSLNLALGKPATASSTESATYSAALAVDGDAGTRWASAFSDPSWIAVDLGSSLTFNRVVLRWEAAFGKSYTIDVSGDGSSWNSVYTQPSGLGGTEDFTFPSTTARYIRMNGTARATINGAQYGYSLFEFEVYDTVQYTLAASAAANGSISPSGNVTVKEGDNQVFTITPAAGYGVQDVLVDGTSVGAVASYTFSSVAAAHTISASFQALPAYTISASAGSNGSISPTGSVSVLQGQNRAFAITANAGYTVDTVTVDGVSVGAVTSYTFSNVTAAHTISATFKIPAVYTITASADPNGSISPSGVVAVTQGTSKTFTMNPATGFALNAVTVDGVSKGAVTTYTFNNVQGPHSISVTFSPGGGVAWSDDFTGPEIDTSKWAFDLGTGAGGDGWGNGEWEYYTSSKDNAYIENGNLVIQMKPDNFGGKPFTSARLVTRGKYSFNHGRFVARIKMPQGNMLWPAFWLLGDHSDDWPKCGEIDIAEMFCGAGTSPETLGKGDKAVFSTGHWWNDTSMAYNNYGLTYLNPTPLADDYHEYELDWDASTLTAKLDGTQYWVMDISAANAPVLSELSSNYFYIILNVAVGLPQWKMTAANQADGPMPQKMYVDWVKVYQQGDSTVLDKVATAPTGTFGILADGTSCHSQLTPGTDSNVYIWNNLTAVTTATPLAGDTSLAVKTTDTSWLGLGVASTVRKNLMKYAAGSLNFSMKLAASNAINFKIGIKGGAPGESWVSFLHGADPFGFVRDGQWHAVSIPMTRFGGTDFSDISQFFMLASDDTNGLNVTGDQTFEIDEIVWSPDVAGNKVAPSGAKFGIYTDAACDAGVFDPKADGSLFIWNTANGAITAGTPFEGANSSVFSAPAAQWYGLGFTPNKLYDLSAFAGGHLHLALKVPASTSTTFKLGIKSPGGQGIRESWIKFQKGSDPYGLVRDGKYHELLIPAADFCNSDFSAIAQLLMIAGDIGPASIEYDDVYWTAN